MAHAGSPARWERPGSGPARVLWTDCSEANHHIGGLHEAKDRDEENGGVRVMTTSIGLICCGGFVIGADMKTQVSKNSSTFSC